MSSTTNRSLLNRAAVKEFTLHVLKNDRPHLADKLTRVSADYYVTLEAKLRSVIREHVSSLPSSGKTIY